MNALGLCLAAFVVTYWGGKRSVGLGIVALMFWGYFFGIVRANQLTTFIYFLFDAAVLGFYLSQKGLFTGGGQRLGVLGVWAAALIGWPLLLLMMPIQPLLISLVGLRGSILFIPMLLAGRRLQGSDIHGISSGLAALNLVALGFAVAEYFIGVPRFYPLNSATIIIYASTDVAQGFHRIPAIFANAHLYGGTMVASIPYLVGGWEQARTLTCRVLALLGIVSALLGVLMSATRLNFVVGSLLLLAAVVSGRMIKKRRVIFSILILTFVATAMMNERFQRFKSLSDTEYVEGRVSGSVNRGFLEIMLEYPMGNGLGGGGTSIPYFLQGQVRNPIGMESDYARILSEQGIIGFLLWLGFLAWSMSRFQHVLATGPWTTSRRLVWLLSLFGLASGAIGMGMLTAIPETAILLLGIGWITAPMIEEAPDKQLVRAGKKLLPITALSSCSHAVNRNVVLNKLAVPVNHSLRDGAEIQQPT